MNNENFLLADAIEVIEEILAGGGEFRMYPKGHSMLPLIVENRDCVVLVRDAEHAIQKHDMVFYRRENGQFVLHRVMKIEKDSTYTMCGDHQATLEKNIGASQIIGRVTKLYRKDKPVNFRSFGYRAYVRIWSFLLFRRCILLAERILRKGKRFLKKKK